MKLSITVVFTLGLLVSLLPTHSQGNELPSGSDVDHAEYTRLEGDAKVWETFLPLREITPRSKAASNVGKSFCKNGIARDFESPFEHMPKVRRPPASGKLPFGPLHTRFYRISPNPVSGSGAGFGYGFSAEHGDERVFHLNWEVMASVSHIDKRGRIMGGIRTKTKHLGEVHNLSRVEFWFPMSASPALYRFDVIFRAQDGSVLGRYAEYFRVVRRKLSVRLSTKAPSYQRGEDAVARVENYGTQTVTVESEFVIEHLINSSWVVDAASPKGPWPLRSRVLRAGKVGDCMSFPLPLDLAPGRYRFGKFVKFRKLDLSGNGVLFRQAEFEVRP